MNNLKFKEIAYCNLIIKHNNQLIKIKEIVYKKIDKYYKNKDVLKKYNIIQEVEIINIEIIKRLGFENKSKKFTKVKSSNEKRNKITGAYE